MPLMKAAVVRSFGQPLKIDEVPISEVTPGQVLVKVVASGVCHTDLHAADGVWPVKPSLPFIPGHFALPIFDVVLNAKTVLGSIVGTRKDLQEALESRRMWSRVAA